MKRIIIIFITIISMKANAQWLEVYYTFELNDAAGNSIDSLSDYKMETVKCTDSSEVLLDIEICSGNKTWRFMEGYRDFNKINFLKITDKSSGEIMTIEFLPSFNTGKKNYYSNLYLGTIKFLEGTYQIKLPQTAAEWDQLKEIKLCDDPNHTDTYYDVREFQK